MNLFEGVRIALSSLRGHKLRTFLTLLGNIVGTMSVIAVVSLIYGADRYVSQVVLDEGTDVRVTVTCLAAPPVYGISVIEECAEGDNRGVLRVQTFGNGNENMLVGVFEGADRDSAVFLEDGANPFSFFVELPGGFAYETAFILESDTGEGGGEPTDGPSGVIDFCEQATTTTIPEVETDIANGNQTNPAVPVLIAAAFLTLAAVAVRARRIER